jgi:2-keto-4-pentenoate hydratase/2-oxohepta-3-ene-1,7-dioic acid hydratase in catechol pathway
MKIARFRFEGDTRLGLVDGDTLVDLTAAEPWLSDDVRPIFADERGVRGRLSAIMAAGVVRHALADVVLEAPVQPSKFLAIGMNFQSHRKEIEERSTQPSAAMQTAAQVWFNKQITTVNPPFADIHLPRVSTALDYEGELAFVIGKRARHVPLERALNHIGGYTICNDVSVRDWQRASPTMTLGKSFDTHGPLGPWIVLPEDIPDPQDLGIRTWVNGELRQDFRTSEMVHTCAQMIAHLSQAFTLEPGDVIATGTGAGVGALMSTPTFLAEGDVVRIEVEKIGVMEHRVAREPSPDAV